MIGFLLLIRVKDIPLPVPESPFKHLEERKASIYENLRDLQFEYRLDKLSDADYQMSKLELQKELAHVMAETDRIKASLAGASDPSARPTAVPPPAVKVVAAPVKFKCPSCGAQ